MKSETMNLVLTFLLGVFVVLGVIFAALAISGQRELRALQYNAAQSQAGVNQLNQIYSLVKDTRDYGKLHPSPEIARMLDAVQVKPATR